LVILLTGLDLRLLFMAVLGQEPWEFDSKVIPMPWRQNKADTVRAKIQTGRLIIGVYNLDGNVRQLHGA
jgi:amidase